MKSVVKSLIILNNKIRSFLYHLEKTFGFLNQLAYQEEEALEYSIIFKRLQILSILLEIDS